MFGHSLQQKSGKRFSLFLIKYVVALSFLRGGGGTLSLLVNLFKELLLNQSILNTTRSRTA